jgi:hypothetical protein
MDARHKRHQVVAPAGLRAGLVNEQLLLQNEYLAAENRILRAGPPGCGLSVRRGPTLAEIGKRLGREALAQVACVMPDQTPSRRGTEADRPQVRWLVAPPLSW